MNYWRTKFIVSFDVEQAGDGVCAVVGRLSLVRSQQSNRNRNTKEKERNIFIRKEMSIKVNCVCSRASPFNPASDPSGPFPFSLRSRPGRERPITHDGLFSFSSFCPPRVLFIYKNTQQAPTQKRNRHNAFKSIGIFLNTPPSPTPQLFFLSLVGGIHRRIIAHP